MATVTILWSLCAVVAMMLAGACGLVWLIERRTLASLMLCILGVAAAALAYAELGMMRSANPAEYGEWLRWYHVPVFLTVTALLLFVRYYLGTGRLWLMWAIILARAVVLAVNFSVQPNFNMLKIVSLRHITVLGEQVSVIGLAIPRRQWQWFAAASVILLIAYLVDAAAQLWLEGRSDSRRKALAVGLGLAAPMFCSVVYTQLLAFGVLQGPVSNAPWFVGALVTMAYELGRDVILSRRSRVETAELRAHLAQAERVTVLGQLVTTLAHELTQPLSATLTNVEAAQINLRDKNPDIEELRAILADIGRDDRRAAELIVRMRQFLKRRAIEMRPLNVEEVVQDVVSLVRSNANSKHVALVLRMQTGLPRVLGDRVHLTQVLLNLVMNGIDAVQSRPPDDRRIVVEAQSDGNGAVEMAVQDSGPGIPDSIADDIFKPFVTTKPEGMGMGLALSRTIIEAHGGQLWTDRITQQEGAIFRFTLQGV